MLLSIEAEAHLAESCDRASMMETWDGSDNSNTNKSIPQYDSRDHFVKCEVVHDDDEHGSRKY